MKIWVSGKFLDKDDAKISVFDRGFLYGDGVFETMRAYAGIVFKLDEHLERMYGALKVLRITAPYPRSYLKDAVRRTVHVNGLEGAYVRLAVTRGEGGPGIDSCGLTRPTTVIIADKLTDYPESLRSVGIRARTAETRQNDCSPLSGIKSMNFLNYILGRMEARENGFAEAILMNTKGRVVEAACANIFLARRGTILTPPLSDGILPGITRAVVIDIAKALRLKVREKAVSRPELMKADEVFLTNSLVEIVPVTNIDSRKIGSGRPGEITKLLHISYQKEVIREVLGGGPFSRTSP